MTKVVLNKCYGGFFLSRAAELIYLDLSGRDVSEYINQFEIPRDDPHLVETVEYLGEDASVIISNLKVVEIPGGLDDYEMDDDDGYETLRECGEEW